VSGARLVSGLAIALAVAACGHTEIHEVVLRAPTPPTAETELYVEGRMPEQPFYEVAILQAIGFGTDADPEDVSAAIVGRSAQLGCDAVVRFRVDVGYSRANGYGVCVRWALPVGKVAPR
jgi:hypothetical protein